ncbi:MAG: hypothetical protein ACLQVI_08745 [Polyangiaceae bacterium]
MKLKGVGLKNTLASLEKLHGKEGLERVKQAMPARLREQLTLVLPIEWYQVEVTAALHIAIRDTVGGGSWDESQRISMEAAKLELSGVYRVMLRAVQYDTVWDRMERMWRQYYDAGEAKWVDRGQGHATAQFLGVAGFNEGMWRSVAGRIEIMLESTGARGQSVTVKEAASTHATLEALWLE